MCDLWFGPQIKNPCLLLCPVFPLRRFFSANRRFVGARASDISVFGNIVNIALKNSKICGNMTFGILEYWTGTKFRAHKRFFRTLAQLFKENMDTSRLAIKLKGTQVMPICTLSVFFLNFNHS